MDGQTDRQTDRILIARPRLHFMQRGKNVVIVRYNEPENPIMHVKLSPYLVQN